MPSTGAGRCCSSLEGWSPKACLGGLCGRALLGGGAGLLPCLATYYIDISPGFFIIQNI